MNLFSKFSHSKKKIISDNIFGKIEYKDMVWTYIPDGSEIDFMVTVCAPETGPSDYQREYFLELRRRLDELILKARNFIENQRIKAICVNTLGIYSINLGDESELKKNIYVIELSDEDANEIHRVTFEDNVPIKYGLED